MSAMASQITSFTIVYSSVCSGSDQRGHQIYASLAFVGGIHRWPVYSPHKGSVTRKIKNNVCIQWQTVSALTRGSFWCLFPELQGNEGNKHQNDTRVSTETVRHESTYIILFLTRHNESINEDKIDDLYTSSPCLTRSVFVLLMTSQSIADDATMTKQLWRDHVNGDI